ncbi:hypothetical protein FRC04_007908 [Tulasnella sp. 424]|nr:hypothetical protein FRC04_007908 [Tulasnella sp. 424]KAG8975091.1 hypothetical protein FRC05_006514 [Tulasnella sp. 425]
MSTASSGSSVSSVSESPSSSYSEFSSSLLRPSFRSSLFDLEADHSEFLANQETLLRTAASFVSGSSRPSVYRYPSPKPAWQTREVADSVLRIEMMLIEAVQEMRMKNWKKKGKKSRRKPRTPEPEPEPELEPEPSRVDRESKSEMRTEYGTTVFDSEAEEIVLQAQWRQLMKNPDARIQPVRRFSTTTRTSRTSDRDSRVEHERTDGTWTSFGDGVGPAYTENTGRATGGYGYGTTVQTPMTMPLGDQYTQSLGGYSPGTMSISYATPSPATGGQQEMRTQPSHEHLEGGVHPPEAGPSEERDVERGRKRTPKGSKSSGRT